MALAYVTQEELRLRLGSGSNVIILDARRQNEYDSSFLKIRSAIRFPPDEVHSRIHLLPRDTEIVVYSHFEKEDTSPQVVLQLRHQGFEKVYPLAGGFQDWLSAGLEMEPK